MRRRAGRRDVRHRHRERLARRRADNDYVAQSLTGQTIPSGSTLYTFNVTVNGDVTAEADETFFVNVTTSSARNGGRRAGPRHDPQRRLTLTPIHDIQGTGATSPIVGSVVTTRGIVTGVTANGFFVQEEDADVDADPATSEGIFVFTSSAPPAAAAFTAHVQVTGTVSEFVPSADPLQPPSTQLTSPTVIVRSHRPDSRCRRRFRSRPRSPIRPARSTSWSASSTCASASARSP